MGLGEPLNHSEKQMAYNSFEYHEIIYNIGDGVFIPSGTHKFPLKHSKHTPSKPSQRDFPDPSDEVTYPELYRKSEYIKGSNSDVPAPFQIGRNTHSLGSRASNSTLPVGRIVKIVSSKKEIWLTLEVFYR